MPAVPRNRLGSQALVASTILLVGCSSPAPAEVASSCATGDEREQRFGTDCTCCHDEFGVAGSIDRASLPIERIVVIGADGTSAEMAPNEFGNFFRHLKLRPPLRASLVGKDGRVARMEGEITHGGCNRCHGATVARIAAR